MQILGILDYRTLVSGRQYAIVGIVVLVAFITPSGDPFTLMILSVPMWLFYEISMRSDTCGSDDLGKRQRLRDLIRPRLHP